MLDKFSETAYKEAVAILKEKGSSIDFDTAFGNGIDIELFIMYVSNSFIYVPKLKEFFDALYETDKIKFYNTARNHELYNRKIFSDKNLEMEVSMRRIFGILLCCLEDEELLEKVIKAIEKEFTWMKNLAKKYNEAEFKKKTNELSSDFYTAGKSPEQINAPIYIFLFLMFMKKGYKTTKSDIWSLYYYIVHFDNQREQYAQNKVIDRIDKIDYTSNIEISKHFKKFYNMCVSGANICNIVEGMEDYLGKVKATSSHLLNFLKTLSEASVFETNNKHQLEVILRNVGLLSGVLEFNGLSIVELLWNYKTDEQERERLLKILSENNQILNEAEMVFARDKNLELYDRSFTDALKEIQSTDLPLYQKVMDKFKENLQDYFLSSVNETRNNTLVQDYLLVFMFDILAKVIKSNRDFYFKNNSETEYYEIQNYQNKTADMELEIEKFNSALAEKDSEIEFLKKQIEDLKNAESKEAKDIVKPYNEEISFLKKQVEDLSKKLSDEQQKADELNKLRTFAFSVQSEDVIEEKEISLSELIKDKKITIVGGHINWRNKMKKKYPKLNLLDGHSTSFDVQTLTSSDVVLLHTGNMSHTVYYKMIDELRTSDIKYDYIGKYNNVNLLEQEIAEIL